MFKWAQLRSPPFLVPPRYMHIHKIEIILEIRVHAHIHRQRIWSELHQMKLTGTGITRQRPNEMKRKNASKPRATEKKKRGMKRNGKQIKMSLLLVFSEMAFVCTYGINIAIFSCRHTNRCEKRSIFQFFALLHTEYDDNIAAAFFSANISHSHNLELAAV